MTPALAFLFGLMLAPKAKRGAATRPTRVSPSPSPRPSPRPSPSPVRPSPSPINPIVVVEPWPQVVPNGLPVFPGPGWVPDHPPPLVVQARAMALLTQLWGGGEGTFKTEQTGGRWITYKASGLPGGGRGVVAYRLRSEGLSPTPLINISTATQQGRQASPSPRPSRSPFPAPTPRPAPSPARRVTEVPAIYIVQVGDNPSKVAEKFTGNPANHIELAKANPRHAPDGRNFKSFWVGMTLTIPARWRQ